MNAVWLGCWVLSINGQPTAPLSGESQDGAMGDGYPRKGQLLSCPTSFR